MAAYCIQKHCGCCDEAKTFSHNLPLDIGTNWIQFCGSCKRETLWSIGSCEEECQ